MSPTAPGLPTDRWPLSVPVLTDGVVTLRAHSPADVDPMLEMAQDEDMVRWTTVEVPHRREMSEEFALTVIPRAWDEGTARGWAVEVDGRYAGNVDLRGTGVADVGFALHPWARGRGIMAAAVRLALDHVLTEGIAEVVHWRAHVGNLASLRVAHATGFTLHGVAPGLLWERGRAIDAWTASYRFGDAPLPRTRWLDVELATPGLRLRPLREDDADRMVEALSDPVTRHWLADVPAPYERPTAVSRVHQAWWEAATGARVTAAVADRHDDRLLGCVLLGPMTAPDPTQAEVAYWTHPAERRRGVMTEALGALVRHAFAPDGLDLRRLALFAAHGNTASHAVARGAGFTRFGTETAGELLGAGTYVDVDGYELLR